MNLILLKKFQGFFVPLFELGSGLLSLVHHGHQFLLQIDSVLVRLDPLPLQVSVIGVKFVKLLGQSSEMEHGLKGVKATLQ